MTLLNSLRKKFSSLIIDFGIVPLLLIYIHHSSAPRLKHFYCQPDEQIGTKNDKSDFNNWRKICFLPFAVFGGFFFHRSEEIERKAEKCLFNSKHLQCNSERKWEKIMTRMEARMVGDGKSSFRLSLELCRARENCLRIELPFNADAFRMKIVLDREKSFN